MKTIYTIFRSALVSVALATSVAHAQSSNSAPVLSPEAQAILSATQDASNFDTLKQSTVGFWVGMSRNEFISRTAAGADGKRTLSFGPYTFAANTTEFDANGKLGALSLEYHSDDPALIKKAYEAYSNALAGVQPDFQHSSSGTQAVPDLQFEMIGWQGDAGEQSALARVYSAEAQKASKVPVTAGVVRFVARISH